MKQINVEKKERSLKYFLIAISFIIIMLWVSIYYLQTHNINQVYNAEQANGYLYLEMINDIIQSNLYSQDIIESLFFERAEMLIHLLMERNDVAVIDSLREKMLIHHICTIDKENNITYSIPGDCPTHINIEDLPLTKEFMLLELEDNPDFVFMVTFRVGQWFVATIKKDDYLSLVRPILLAVVFEKLSSQISTVAGNTLPQVEYVVIQDKKGILAATSNVTKMARISSDKFLEENLANETTSSRETTYNGNPALEVVRPFYFEDEKPGLLRLGISLESIYSLKTNRIILFIIYSVIFLGILLMEFLFYRNHIKARKMVETLQQSKHLASIGELGREVSHEIKNPLNAISMTLQRLREERKTLTEEEINKYLSVTFTEIDRLNSIIEKFLSFSRPILPKLKKVNVHTLLEDIVLIFHEESKKKDVEITLRGDRELFWILDRDLIRQVLINLLKNALEAFNGDTDAKKVSLSFHEKRDSILIIEIKDNGKGISKNIEDSVWALYVSTKAEGNGLGLPISKKIIDAHGGSIEISSNKEQGTIVIILLPNKDKV
ncbi:MAG TPA: GHKL domain-containing protein [Candidatus Cloacimonetes bacterium]|nr:GHKL domain-containing protein [Candidatus Cloacimonadota bacterium]HEX37257.1 GHKL domain-containing protein [Candidatus Cloacimonadota bacterium]